MIIQQLANMISRIAVLVSIVVGVISAYDCPGGQTPPLVLKGKRFYDSSTNTYVPIKGIAYNPRPNGGEFAQENNHDYFTDEFQSRWEADIESMKELGVNAVRIYAVDPSKNHDTFMCTLSEAGIYVSLGLLADCEDCGIGAWVGNNAEPPLCYPSTVKERGQFVINSFSIYDNIMGFSAGNEVTIYADDGMGGPRQINAPCQKKFVSDMRKYVATCSGGNGPILSRSIPIGLENWDGNQQIFAQHVYYHCRTDPNDIYENVEWFGINSYRHCDGTVQTPADIVGWPELKADFATANFPGPVLFGEYGCRNPSFQTIDGFEAQRTWLQTEALYSPSYNDVFAGGFVFELSAEKKVIDDNLSFMAIAEGLSQPSSVWPYQKFARENHGIGYFDPIDCDHNTSGGNLCQYVQYPEFQTLTEALAKSDTTNTIAQQQLGVIPDCPPQYPVLSTFTWPTDADDEALQACLVATQPPTGQPSEVATGSTVAPSGSPTALPSEVTINSTVVPNGSNDTDSPTTTIVPMPTEEPVLQCSSFCDDDRGMNGDRHCSPGDMADQCGSCDYCNESGVNAVVMSYFGISIIIIATLSIVFQN